MENRNEILELSVQFALEIVKFTEELEAKRKFVIANQLLKSGTSVGANVFEAQSAESRADFIHKMKISAKEADETEYWLLLCKHSQHLSTPTDDFLQKLKEIQLILSKIISTSKS